MCITSQHNNNQQQVAHVILCCTDFVTIQLFSVSWHFCLCCSRTLHGVRSGIHRQEKLREVNTSGLTTTCQKIDNIWYWVQVPQRVSNEQAIRTESSIYIFCQADTPGRSVMLQLKNHMEKSSLSCVRCYLEHSRLSFASTNTAQDSRCTSFREVEEVQSCPHLLPISTTAAT